MLFRSEHFVIYKGRDACDIIMKKIKTSDRKYSDMEPISIYHVEYEPRLVIRGTTSYPPDKRTVKRHSEEMKNKSSTKNY